MRQKQLAPFPFYMKEKVLADWFFHTHQMNQELCNTGLKKKPYPVVQSKSFSNNIINKTSDKWPWVRKMWELGIPIF